jgi:tetratricopeptide (TPR) repeat protein
VTPDPEIRTLVTRASDPQSRTPGVSGQWRKAFGLLLFSVSLVGAVDLNPPELQSLVNRALEHAYRQEYESAEAVLNQVIEAYPDNPAGYFFFGALRQLYMFDVGSDSLEPAFNSSLDQAWHKAEAVLQQEENARAHLYLGAVNTYRAIYYGWKGKFWDTYKWGTKAPAEMTKALALDSSLSDACVDLGVSEYFSYAAGRYLTGLPVFGSCSRAVELLEQAIDGDGYFSLTAGYALAWIWSHEKRYVESESILLGLLATYPGNRLFRKLLRDTYYEQKDYASAVAVAAELGQELGEVQPDNAQARTENYLTWAKGLYYSGDLGASRACCDSIISYEPQRDAVIGLGKFIKAAKALKRRT